MVTVMSVSNIRVFKCFIVEERRISRTYRELVKQDSVFFASPVLIIGERAKRARHSHVCSIENRGYIYILCIVRAKFCSYNP